MRELIIIKEIWSEKNSSGNRRFVERDHLCQSPLDFQHIVSVELKTMGDGFEMIPYDGGAVGYVIKQKDCDRCWELHFSVYNTITRSTVLWTELEKLQQNKSAFKN